MSSPFRNGSNFKINGKKIRTLHTGKSSWSRAQGTGFLVSENVMLTVGHICYSKKNNSGIKEMKVYFGIERAGTSYIDARASTIYVCANYTYYGDAVQDDYAIIVLDSDVGNTTGWFSLKAENANFLNNSRVTMTGFPGDMDVVMCTDTGNIIRVNTYDFYHDIPSVNGNSGSPIYNGNTVYGIHSASSAYRGHARRITQEVIDWLYSEGLVN